MNSSWWIGIVGGPLVLSGVAGCEAQTEARPQEKAGPAKPAASAPEKPEAEVKRKLIGKNVYFETQGDVRRVVISATVCLREGQLEGLLTRRGTKEHEYILVMDADAKLVHAGLIGAGAKAGSPVRFEPKYMPASGTVIKVMVRYTDKDGKTVTRPAQEWMRDVRNKKDMPHDWVFAGSHFVQDPEDKDKPPYYLANQGDVICCINMPGAMMDLPIKNSNSDPGLGDRVYDAHTERIPKMGTWVEVILEPVLDKEKKEEEKKPEKSEEEKKSSDKSDE